MPELKNGQFDMKLEGVLRESRLAARHRHRGGRFPRRAHDATQLGNLDHLRQGDHVGQAWLGAQPGSAHSLVLVVDDLDAARNDLIARGVEVSEVFHFPGGPFNTPWTTRASAGATLRVVPTSRLPRSRIRTGTAGCSRRSRHGFRDASGSQRE
ncbi:MAG: hypothetical protein ACR2G5_00635 [Pyrinomonadaceae bacterium]